MIAVVAGGILLFLIPFVILPALDAATRSDDRGVTRLDAADVPDGVSAWTVGDRRVFLVRQGDSVRAFLATATHLENEPIWWCPSVEAFVSPMHGEAYDTSGRVIHGPARRALDELPVALDGGTIEVARGPVRTGAPVDDEAAQSDRAVDVGLFEGETFCPDRLD